MNELCFSAWWSRLSRANSFETNTKTTKGDERKKRKMVFICFVHRTFVYVSYY